MAMGMRVGAGGVPILPFAGDPNGVGGPTPVVGQILVDTVGGGVYQGVRGGLFDRQDGGTEVLNLATAGDIVPNPITQSFSFLYAIRHFEATAVVYPWHLMRSVGAGYIATVTANAVTNIFIRKTNDRHYTASQSGLLGRSANIAVSWDHVTSTLKTKATGNAFANSNTEVLASGGTATTNNIVSTQFVKFALPFYAMLPRALSDAEIEGWCDSFVCPSCADALQLLDMRTTDLVGAGVLNKGSAGGTFQITDGSPTDWGTALTWMRIS